MRLPRRVLPEWLDTLDAADPRALRSRADLRRLHSLMRHRATLPRVLGEALTAAAAAGARPVRFVELGAGDASFLQSLAPQLAACHPRVRLVLVDQSHVVLQAVGRFEAQGWETVAVVGDAFDWLQDSSAEADLLFCNLFLHHFEPPRLSLLLAAIARRTQRFVACEPARSRIALSASHLLGLVGCNAVTRHDAVRSVHAGFSGEDLSALWPADAPESWLLTERPLPPFSHLFCATRR